VGNAVTHSPNLLTLLTFWRIKHEHEHISIEAVNQAVRQAVSKDNEAKGKWQAAGQAVAGSIMTAENLEAVKAQFIADAILPAIDKKHAQALAVDLPRKGSKDYNEL
jgi:hypothetical protein